MSRVPPKTCPRRGAAPAAVSLLFTTLAVGGIALPAVAATDATPAAKAPSVSRKDFVPRLGSAPSKPRDNMAR